MPGEATVKVLVRHRDGFKCVRCGMTDEEHREKYTNGLQVHRKEPGSKYTVEGCETLCVGCHKRKPQSWGRRFPRPKGGKQVVFILTDDEQYAVEGMATKCRLSAAGFLRAAVLELLANFPDRKDAIRAVAERLMAEHDAMLLADES